MAKAKAKDLTVELRKKTAKCIVDAILADLTDRRGLRQEWDLIDRRTQQEIRREWFRLAVVTIGDCGL